MKYLGKNSSKNLATYGRKKKLFCKDKILQTNGTICHSFG